MSAVGIGDLPIEILERILENLEPEEACTSARLVNKRFLSASYNVVRTEFLTLRHRIKETLDRARRQLSDIVVTVDTFHDEMLLVAKFTFLQLLYSEYQILSTIFFQKDSNAHSAVIYKAITTIKKFNALLSDNIHHEVSWKTNISEVLDNLRELNSGVCDDYFWNNWNIKENPFGPLFLKLICCAICSRYEISVCHESNPQFRDTKCHLHGAHDIPDLSHTLSPLASGLKNVEKRTRMLAVYICDSIRWSNVFHTLTLRWICMDRALIFGRALTPSWPLLASEEYLPSEREILSETETELRNRAKRLCRVLKKGDGGQSGSGPNWLGIRSDFRIWCPLTDVPEEMFKDGELSEYSQLPEGSKSFRPYLFKLNLKIHIHARRFQKNDGIEETIVWFEETPEKCIITQSKQLIN